MQKNIKLSRKRNKNGSNASDSESMAPTRKSPRKALRKTPIKQVLKTFSPSIKKINGAASVTVNVTPTSNYYDPLTNIANEVVVTKEKKLRIPPITLFNTTRDEVQKSMQKLQIENYDSKLLKYGIQIFCKSTENFSTVSADLVKSQRQFYTHDLPSNKLFKVVLRGLHQLEITELTNEIKLHNVTPESIKIITPKNVRYANHVNYILYFKKGEVKLDELRKIRSLFHTIVTWEPYRIQRTGPIQCNRCQRPGHGARHCNMMPRCEFCAEEHDSKNCPRFQEIQKKAEEVSANGGTSIDLSISAKCCNCDQVGHFASDPGCPKKKAYAERRTKRSSNGKKAQQPTAKFSKEDFPVLSENAISNATTRTPQAPSGSYAQQVTFSPGKPTASFNNFNSFVTNNGSANMNKIDAPFSFEEMMSLTSDILINLRNVRTASREDVLIAVMQISLKYLYNDGSK